VFGCADSTVKKWVENAGQAKHKKPDHSPSKRKAALAYYASNPVSIAATAKKYGVHPKTMARWIADGSVKKRDVRKFDKKKILQDIKGGLSGASIARKHGCSESYVSALRNGRI
jgi:transposase-like protein